MTSTRLVLAVIALGFPFAITHCSSSDSADSPGGVSGSGGGTTVGIDVVLPPGGAGGTESNPGGLYNPLCGGFDTHDCNPDDPNACRDVEVDGATSGTGSDTTGSGGSTGSETTDSGGSTGLGGQAGATGAPGDAGAAGAGGEGGADDSDRPQGPGTTGATSGGGSGSSGTPADAGPDVSVESDADPLMPSGVACRVNATEDGPVRGCGLAGAGQDSDPCTSAADCAGGFACVSEGNAGICRPYCCAAGQDPCASGSYCGERSLFGSTLDVPVCVRADNCSLSETYPCEGDDCQCAEGTACLVVRRDGTTTCAVPGEGVAGDECPCASGHICSQASGTCLKLCDTVVDEDPPQCGDGICQAAANLPGTWGVCINTDSR